MLKLPEGPKKVVSGPLVHGSPPFQDLANAVNIDFLRILRLAGAQKRGRRNWPRTFAFAAFSLFVGKCICWRKIDSLTFFWAVLICHVALPCYRNKMHSKHWQMLKYVEMFWWGAKPMAVWRRRMLAAWGSDSTLVAHGKALARCSWIGPELLGLWLTSPKFFQ